MGTLGVGIRVFAVVDVPRVGSTGCRCGRETMLVMDEMRWSVVVLLVGWLPYVLTVGCRVLLSECVEIMGQVGFRCCYVLSVWSCLSMRVMFRLFNSELVSLFMLVLCLTCSSSRVLSLERCSLLARVVRLSFRFAGMWSSVRYLVGTMGDIVPCPCVVVVMLEWHMLLNGVNV